MNSWKVIVVLLKFCDFATYLVKLEFPLMLLCIRLNSIRHDSYVWKNNLYSVELEKYFFSFQKNFWIFQSRSWDLKRNTRKQKCNIKTLINTQITLTKLPIHKKECYISIRWVRNEMCMKLIKYINYCISIKCNIIKYPT